MNNKWSQTRFISKNIGISDFSDVLVDFNCGWYANRSDW
jgi:hypothetical protein